MIHTEKGGSNMSIKILPFRSSPKKTSHQPDDRHSSTIPCPSCSNRRTKQVQIMFGQTFRLNTCPLCHGSGHIKR